MSYGRPVYLVLLSAVRMGLSQRVPVAAAARAVAVLAVAALVLFGGAAGARAETGVGSWSATGQMLEGWEGGAGSAVTLADGSVLAVRGGEHGATELYDPGSGVWTRGLELPASGGRWTVVALAEGGALLLGEAPCGRPEHECLPTTSTFRLSSNGSELTPAAPMHEVRVGPIAVQLAGGRVLVAGGFGDECPEIVANGYSCQPLSSAEIYDPASNEWSSTASMPEARGGASATLLSDGTVLVLGGDEAQDAVRYDPGTETWTAAGQAALPRTGSLLLALPGDRALVVGSQPEVGFFGSLGKVDRELLKCLPVTSEIFAGASNAWMVSPIEPGGSENCVYPLGALLSGGQVLFAGAQTSDLTYLSSSYDVLDAAQRCWSTIAPPVVEQRNDGTVVALSDGRALVFGGRAAGGSSLATAEIYTPGSPVCATPPPVEPPQIGPPSKLLESGSPRFAGATIMHVSDLTVTAAGAVRLLAQCPASAAGRCVGHVQLALLMATYTRARTKSHGHLLLGKAFFSISAGRTAAVTVYLTEHKRMLHSAIHRWGRAAIMLTGK